MKDDICTFFYKLYMLLQVLPRIWLGAGKWIILRITLQETADFVQKMRSRFQFGFNVATAW